MLKTSGERLRSGGRPRTAITWSLNGFWRRALWSSTKLSSSYYPFIIAIDLRNRLVVHLLLAEEALARTLPVRTDGRRLTAWYGGVIGRCGLSTYKRSVLINVDDKIALIAYLVAEGGHFGIMLHLVYYKRE
jgi:hypothetical protein